MNWYRREESNLSSGGYRPPALAVELHRRGGPLRNRTSPRAGTVLQTASGTFRFNDPGAVGGDRTLNHLLTKEVHDHRAATAEEGSGIEPRGP